MKLKTAVIGAGKLGAIHARIYNQISELVCICDINKKRHQEIESLLKRKIDFEPDYKKIIKKYNIDAVSIATPTRSHFEIAEYFLKKGIPCLVEKPLVTGIKEAHRLLSLAKKKKLALNVGLTERFNSAYERVKKIISNPRFIECHRLSPYPYRSLDISVVLDLMIHDLDITLDLINAPVQKVEAVGVKVLSPHLDIANVRLTFANHAIANITTSRISKEKIRKFRVFFSSAYASLDYARQEVELYYKKGGKSLIKKKLAIKKEEPLKKELKKFLSEVKSRKAEYASTENAIKALRLALKIEKLAKA